MKKLILASTAAFGLLAVAACSDSTDTTTTQSVEPPVQTMPAPSDPAMQPTPEAPADDVKPVDPAPAQPAPAPAPAQ
ncbi:MAG: hypothetical protein WBF87_08650 [Mesorhizobium sp.]